MGGTANPNATPAGQEPPPESTVVAENETAEGQTPPAEETQAESEAYDPSDHTVAEVQAYLAEHPDETDAVLDLERAGKARVTLLDKEN
jgi:hypothetical protein